MPTKRKQTNVETPDYAAIPAVSLRIIAFLLDHWAYSRESAVKITAIARAIGSDPGEVAFEVLELYGYGFAALAIPNGENKASTSVYIETDKTAIRNHILTMESSISQLRGRADGLRAVASAMGACCHRWSV